MKTTIEILVELLAEERSLSANMANVQAEVGKWNEGEMQERGNEEAADNPQSLVTEISVPMTTPSNIPYSTVNLLSSEIE